MITDKSISNIIAVCFTCCLLSAQTAIATDEATVKLFNSKCSSCHGSDGKADTMMGKKKKIKDWTDGKTLSALTDDKIKTIMRDGIKEKEGKYKMKPVKNLSDEQMTAIVSYIRLIEQGKR